MEHLYIKNQMSSLFLIILFHSPLSLARGSPLVRLAGVEDDFLSTSPRLPLLLQLCYKAYLNRFNTRFYSILYPFFSHYNISRCIFNIAHDEEFLEECNCKWNKNNFNMLVIKLYYHVTYTFHCHS